MAQTIERLTKKFVETVSGGPKPRRYADGRGLYLAVAPTGSKSWIFRYPNRERPGQTHWMGLGSVHDVSLTEAREQVATYRKQVRLEDVNPIEARRQRRADARTERIKIPTFKECADAYIETHSASWSNPVHRRQWRQTLDDYVIPHIGQKRVDHIDAKMIADAIKPIWTSRPETGRRVRARIENILHYATAIDARSGDNPAIWSRLKPLLPPQDDRARHHAALPWAEIPAFMPKVAEMEGSAAAALQFTILTAARTGEVIGATWAEVDLENKVWTIPAARMKAKREHRVPLSEAAIAVLGAMKPAAIRGGAEPSARAPLFPGWRAGTHLSNMAMMSVLKRMDRANITVHGMRSAFRDWVSEATDYQGEVAEAALAHIVGDKVEAAYRRGDLFAKRARMMADWARYCTSGASPANDTADPHQESAAGQVAA